MSAEAVVLQGYDPGSIGAVIDVLADPALWLGAIGGGAFGAAIGALPAFVFTGFLVIAGAFQLNTVTEGGVEGLAHVGIGFGPIFGPHISFAAGAAAAAYAASRGDIQSGFDYHSGKDITVALGSRPDILAVGAGFGIFGMLSEAMFRHLAVPTDPIAITVVLSALLHRVVFGYSLIGVVSSKADGYFDMGPFEREEMRPSDEVPGDGDKSGEERFAVEPWLPEMYQWSHVATIGVIAGLLGGYLALQSGNAFLGFGFSAASLLFLNLGLGKIPVTHHMTLPASTSYLAATATFDSVALAMILAAVFGLLGALIGEAFQRVFYAHGDTHVDPPAASIAITHTLIAVLAIVGVFTTSVWVPGAV